MAKLTINVGTNQDDGTGDLLRAAFVKVNDNFTHIDFSVKELKKYIKQIKSKSRSLKDCRIQWDYDTYKWRWMRESSTLEFFM